MNLVFCQKALRASHDVNAVDTAQNVVLPGPVTMYSFLYLHTGAFVIFAA